MRASISPRLGVIVLLLGLVAVLALFLRPRSAEFGNVAELAAAMESKGIECNGLQVSKPNPTPEIVDFGSCSVDGKTINLHVYKENERVEEHIRDNVSVRGQNPNYFTSLVAGSNWVVDTYSEETSALIQEALGGELH